jgi:predicted site-specific integrase-resolvase
MNEKHLNQRQLADRWDISLRTLERWRCEGIGPHYLKLHGRVLYRVKDIENFEEQCLRVGTVSFAADQLIKMMNNQRLSKI